jgi:hypothetical protein
MAFFGGDYRITRYEDLIRTSRVGFYRLEEVRISICVPKWVIGGFSGSLTYLGSLHMLTFFKGEKYVCVRSGSFLTSTH